MTTSHPAPRRRVRAGLVVAAAVLSLAGCEEVEEAATGSGYEPSTVGATTEAGVKPVTFTAEAAKRVDLQTETAVLSGQHTVVSYAALIYDGKGTSWVYTTPQSLTYLRVEVAVDRIEGDRVLLSGGLPPGTDVVTVGAAEVYGSELNIDGSH